jgi:predicted RNase H-like nuclease (RuvC/YqgF family)
VKYENKDEKIETLRAENERLREKVEILEAELHATKVLATTLGEPVYQAKCLVDAEVDRLRELLKNVVGDVDDYIRYYAVDQARLELGIDEPGKPLGKPT